ncbi:MAG TPA: FGGY family carbohydrate kinase, partial [Longimicrobium sp.]|nr:FGGY family carbohydrate kinase [Longimicrobium sp.]
MEAARGAGITPAAVAVAAFWHGLAGIGGDAAALTPLTGWGDGRARSFANALRARVDEAALHRRTGCWLHESYPAVRLHWLRARAGDSFPRSATWGSLGELLCARLFGQLRTSVSMASGTGLLDVHRLAWDGEALDAAGITAAELPALSDEPLRGLRPQWGARWPELAAVPWFLALGDGACASLGSGAVGPRVALSVGTSAAVRVLRGETDPTVADGLWCYRLDARRCVHGRALSNGGNGPAWLRRTLRLPDGAELERRIAEMAPGAHGLRIVPRLLPERPPGTDAWEGAAIHGLTAATGPVEVARAWLEAAAFAMADALDAVEAAFGPADEVAGSGGALHASPAWARIIADVLGRPLRLHGGESTLRGAALIALERIGAIDDATAVPPASDGALIEPDPAAHAVHRAMRGV